MVKYKTVNGYEVPKEARKLTRRENGVMMSWYDHNQGSMHATLLYRKGKLIGWCALVLNKSIHYQDELKGDKQQ